jgi:hypothetical protein
LRLPAHGGVGEKDLASIGDRPIVHGSAVAFSSVTYLTLRVAGRRRSDFASNISMHPAQVRPGLTF